MYSEHLIAALLRTCAARTDSGQQIDAGITRLLVTVGRMIGPDLNCAPSDAALIDLARTFNHPAALGTRGAVHTLSAGRAAIGLGATRGAVETAGTHLVHLTRFEAHRYTGAWYLPGVLYGGLI